jgi:hypothetical protein
MSSLYDIQHAFEGKLVGSKKMKSSVSAILQKMTEEIVDFVTQHVWFISSYEDAYAFTFTGNDFDNKHVVFLSDDLFMQDEEQIRWTIAHEIGHIVLGHKNRFKEKFGKEIVEKQEKEADVFAAKYTAQ